METNLLKFIWRYSRRQQITVVLMTMLSFPILYLTLELPKWIINDALGDSVGPLTFFGFELEPVPFLATLCLMLLGLIILNGILKMRINTLKGIIGESLIRRLRYGLIHNTLRFPLPYFSRISSGELISTVTSETEPLGGYIGESIALPLFQGGTMITILVFMFAQDWVFGLVSIALIPVQGYLIPKLQHQVNLLKKERVRHVRKLSERIGETVAGATEIRLHGTQPYTLSEFSRRLGDLFGIRMEIFKKKFFMKFLNNTIGQITPFLFYLFGGYLVIKGDLTIGALVAAIGAYKDLTSPWRELLNFYQLHEDSKIKYQQIIELFNPGELDIVDEVEPADTPAHLSGDLEISNLSWRNDSGETVLSGINLRVKQGEMIAITGDYAIRRARLAQILCNIESPSSGHFNIGGVEIDSISNALLRRRLGFVGTDPHMFVGSIAENMEYGLNHLEPEAGSDKLVLQSIVQAQSSGNRPPIDQGWLDYSLIAEEQQERATDWYGEVTKAIGADGVVYDRSLLEVFDPVDKPELAERLLQARKILRTRFSGVSCAEDIALFDPDNFNPNASIAENVLYGVALDERLNTENFTIHPYFIKVLDDQKLHKKGLQAGYKVARFLINGLDQNTITHNLIEHFGLAEDERVDEIRFTVDNFKSEEKLSESCSCLLLSLFMLVVPDRHSFASIDARDLTRLLQARREFAESLPEDLRDAVLYFDAEKYHSKLTVKDNLLFGRVSTSTPSSERTVNKIIEEVIDQLDLRKDLMVLLGESQVGISGSRLPLVARHRIGLGRVLMKTPDILVFHDALSPLDSNERMERLQNIRTLLPETTIIWLAREIEQPTVFDQIYEFTESGPLKKLGVEMTEVTTEQQSQPAKRSSSAMDLVSHSILFSELAPRQQRFIAENSKLVKIPANTVIYERGDAADAAWLVVAGEVMTTVDGNRMGTFKRPEVFGAMDVLADCPRIMNAQTVTDTTILRIEASAIETVALSDAKVSRTLLRSLSLQWRR